MTRIYRSNPVVSQFNCFNATGLRHSSSHGNIWCLLSLVGLCVSHLRLPCKAGSRCEPGRGSRVHTSTMPRASAPCHGRGTTEMDGSQRKPCGWYLPINTEKEQARKNKSIIIWFQLWHTMLMDRRGEEKCMRVMSLSRNEGWLK